VKYLEMASKGGDRVIRHRTSKKMHHLQLKQARARKAKRIRRKRRGGTHHRKVKKVVQAVKKKNSPKRNPLQKKQKQRK